MSKNVSLRCQKYNFQSVHLTTTFPAKTTKHSMYLFALCNRSWNVSCHMAQKNREDLGHSSWKRKHGGVARPNNTTLYRGISLFLQRLGNKSEHRWNKPCLCVRFTRSPCEFRHWYHTAMRTCEHHAASVKGWHSWRAKESKRTRESSPFQRFVRERETELVKLFHCRFVEYTTWQIYNYDLCLNTFKAFTTSFGRLSARISLYPCHESGHTFTTSTVSKRRFLCDPRSSKVWNISVYAFVFSRLVVCCADLYLCEGEFCAHDLLNFNSRSMNCSLSTYMSWLFNVCGCQRLNQQSTWVPRDSPFL